MRFKIIAILVLFCAARFCAAQQDLTYRWTSPEYFTNATNSLYSKLLVDEQDNVYFCGTSYDIVFATAFMTLKYDSLGNFLWDSKFDYFLTDLIKDAVLSPDGVIVAGPVSIIIDTSTWVNRALVIGYDGDGAVTWDRYLYDPASTTANVLGLEMDQDNNLYAFGGYRSLDEQKYQSFVHKINPVNGEPIWETVIQDSLAGVQIAMDGKLVGDRLRVLVNKSKQGLRYALHELDLDGNLLASSDLIWGRDIGKRYCLDVAGDLVIGDTSICKMNILGDTAWCLSFLQGYPNTVGRATVVSSDAEGNILGTGFLKDTLSLDYTTRTVKISPTGELIWSKSMSQTDLTEIFEGGEKIAKSGNYALVGNYIHYVASSLDSSKLQLLLYNDQDGSLLWDTLVQLKRFNELDGIYGSNDAFYVAIESREGGGNHPYLNLMKFAIDDPTSGTRLRLVPPPSITTSPNPFTNEVVVAVEAMQGGEVQVCLFNATGQQVYASVETLSKGGNQLRLDGLGDLPEGFYLLTLVSDGKSFSRKLVKAAK